MRATYSWGRKCGLETAYSDVIHFAVNPIQESTEAKLAGVGYPKDCWRDSSSRDTSPRQGWIDGEGSRQDLHDESNTIQMTASVAPARGLVALTALMGAGICAVATFL